VLEAAGFDVTLADERKCCGRPAFSVGRLDRAKQLGEHNVGVLTERYDKIPVIFLEPSCYSMFAEDYRELRINGAERLAQRCFLFEQFLNDLLEREPAALAFEPGYHWVAIHAHCHAKALTDTSVMTELARRLPNSTVNMLNTGCCGMAGAFGALSAKYELSLKVAEPLVAQINNLRAGTHVIASGTSCRHQIDHLTPVTPLHVAELLAQALLRPSQGP
ncbi:MAG: hypothetical protein HY706_20960, partial [Candidatus Hydrogenedentes bacterium]|nr:hypothetical protein [Candidatus Hydrogenedentota bacterium]